MLVGTRRTKDGKPLPTGECLCGCGEFVTDTRRFFLVGHDKKAVARAIEEVYGNEVEFVMRWHEGRL